MTSIVYSYIDFDGLKVNVIKTVKDGAEIVQQKVSVMPKMDIITRMEETEKLLADYPNLDSTTINELPLYAFQMLINRAKEEKIHCVMPWGYTVNRNGKRVSYSF